jgi:anti-sigma regulatory factor (Ser/Thr protein kinase)
VRRFEGRFDPRPENAAAARDLVRAAVRESTFDPDDAVLLTGELVNNAIRHAETEFAVRVEVDEDAICVVVSNHAPEFLPLGRDPSAYGGRGLMIMSALADEWGFVRQPEDKRVWFRLFKQDG